MNDPDFLMQLMAENVNGFTLAFAMLIDELADSKAIDKDHLMTSFRQTIDVMQQSSNSQAIHVLKLIHMMMALNDSGAQQAMQKLLRNMPRGR